MYKLEFYSRRLIENPEKTRLTVEGELVLFKDNEMINEWPERTGPWGNGSMPHMIAEIVEVVKLPDIPANLPFKKESFPWIARMLMPLYVHRTAIALHPDGNVVGTEGCGGIYERDEECFYMLSEALEISKRNGEKFLYYHF